MQVAIYDENYGQRDSFKYAKKLQGKPGSTNTNANIPSFLVKTYDIVNEPSLDEIIAWN